MTGLYIHIPFCAQKCFYCDFYSLPNKESSMQNYVDALLYEAECYKHLTFDTVFFGGGTPSLLGTKLFEKLLEGLRSKLLIKSVETTVEVNPESATVEFLQTCKSGGVSRISIGIQSLDDYQLKAVGRIHDKKQALKALEIALNLGFESVSADVIVGLPGQTWQTLEETLEVLTDSGIKHLSAYGLQLEHETPLGRNPLKDTPDDDFQVELLEQANQLLASKGFVQYEISNYAKPGFECKHNLIYWRCQEYVGLGAGASSHLENIRFKNKNDLDAYIANPFGTRFFEENVEGIEKIREKLMLGLRLLVEGVSVDEQVRKQIPELDELVSTGDLVFNNQKFTIHPSKVYISNRIFGKVLGL
ncbi:MAG: radical SAM family heme chaperone HemW [Caldisericia bacterium]|nr:radical SAM family heme chaperone HemW [Caldisericia bacterium]